MTMFFYFRARPCRNPSTLVQIDELSNTLMVADDTQGNIRRPSPKRQALPASVPRRHFCNFDGLFNSQASYSQQEDVFNAIVPRLIESLQKGAGCTIVTYGGAAAGKTYTLQGVIGENPKLHGLVPRAIPLIFDVLEAAAPTVEACFFEVVGDTVFDLLPKDGRGRVTPGVTIREFQSSAQVQVNHCTQHRCDRDSALQVAMDCYRTGAERQRRNALASCFQLALSYPTPDGKTTQKSFIRFVELNAVRQNERPTPRSMVQQRSVGSLTKATVSVAGQSSNSLEQILMAKVSGDVRAAYKGSPVGLLLKPCLEGTMPMLFLLCARLEEAYISTLQGSCRVMKMLQQLNSNFSKLGINEFVTETGKLQDVPTPGRVRSSVVQAQYHLYSPETNVSHRGPSPQGKTSWQAQSPETSAHAGPQAISRSPPRPPVLAAGSAFSAQYDASPETAACFESPGTYNMYSEALANAVEPANELDAQAVKTCYESLCVKRKVAEVCVVDTERSRQAVDEIEQVIKTLQAHRAETLDGPSEKETNMKKLYVKINQSLQRGLANLKSLQSDMDTFAMVCSGQSVPDQQYDSYNVRGADLEAIRKYHAAPASSTQPNPNAAQSEGPSARSSRSHCTPAIEPSPSLMPERFATGSQSSPVIPTLQLDNLAPVEEQNGNLVANGGGDPSIVPNIDGGDSSSSDGSLSPQPKRHLITQTVLLPSPSAPTILVPTVSTPPQPDSSTPKAGSKRGVGIGGRKGSGGSQPKQKSLMRQASRTSLLDLHDDGTQPRTEGNGLSEANVAEMLHNTIHSDDDEVIEVACNGMGSMTPAPGTFTPLRPMESPMLTPMVSPMMTPLVPTVTVPSAMVRNNSCNRMTPAVDGAIIGGNMVKSVGSTPSPTPVQPPPPSVVASPYGKHRPDRVSGHRHGAISPPQPQCRMVWPFDRGVQLVPSPAQPQRSQTPQPHGHALSGCLNGGSPMPNSAWPIAKSASPMGRRPSKMSSSPTQATSNVGLSCSPSGYSPGYVAVSAINRSGSMKHLSGY